MAGREHPTRKGIPAAALSEMPQTEAKSMDCGPGCLVSKHLLCDLGKVT